MMRTVCISDLRRGHLRAEFVPTLQRDELLTQSEILEKETLPLVKVADQHAEAEPDEAHHGQDL